MLNNLPFVTIPLVLHTTKTVYSFVVMAGDKSPSRDCDPPNRKTPLPFKAFDTTVGREARVACEADGPPDTLLPHRPTVVVARVLPVFASNSVAASLASHHPTHPLISVGADTAVNSSGTALWTPLIPHFAAR
jgi:hypothetical protein